MLHDSHAIITARPPVEQHPHDLALIVCTGELPTTLCVLAQQAVSVGPWRFVFHIIGESHWVRIERDGEPPLHEVLACIDLAPAVCLHHHRFVALQPHAFQRPGYRIALRTRAVAEGDDADWQPTGALSVEFPVVHGQRPVTRLVWRQTGELMAWRTLHTYPSATGSIWVESASAYTMDRHLSGSHG
jgi:hypothetical protein